MATKKVWQTPKVMTYGTVEELTQQDKKYGYTDGFTFQGVDITNNS